MNHIHLGTQDLNKSVSFYTSIFGFRKKFDHPPGIFLENSDGFLLAIDPVERVPALPAWYHLGLCLDSENEVLDLYSQCQQANIQIARDLMHEPNQFASFFVVDPDGYKIEISWHNE